MTSPEDRVRVLVVDDEAALRRLLTRIVEDCGYEAISVGDAEAAIERLEARDIDVVLTDLQMPGDDGLTVLKRSQEIRRSTPVIVVTGHGSVESAIAALREGAYDYILKPFKPDYIAHRLDQAVERLLLQAEVRALRRELSQRSDADVGGRLLGRSVAMQRVFDLISRVGRNDVPVLINGETGTGKELVAREIHHCSTRQQGPFLAVNCGALSDHLLESELFGHVKGAFTGATSDKKGYFEAASGGTLLLDEIGEMPASLQVKLLRVLQERKVTPVGSTEPRDIDVRIVAATHRDLHAGVEEGEFREDLFYRLNVVEIEVPPLRERREDIPELCVHFLNQCAGRFETPAERFTPEALQKLVGYHWPGNVRQLQNVVMRGATLCGEEEIDVSLLPPDIAATRIVTQDLDNYVPTLEEVERRHIDLVLRRTDGNKSKAATILGIDRSTLYRKCKQYALD